MSCGHGPPNQAFIRDFHFACPDGTVIHQTAAERTKFCSSHKRRDPETVTQPALTCDRLEPLFSGHFSDTGPHVRRFFAGVPR